MLVTNHVLSGAVLGALLPGGPVAAFVAGAVSHFALDAVPHWGDVDEADFLPVAVRDGLAGLAAMGAVTLVTSPRLRSRVLAGMAGAAFPDLDKPSRLFFGRSPFPASLDAFHDAIQRESRDRMGQELVVGAVLAATAVRLARRR